MYKFYKAMYMGHLFHCLPWIAGHYKTWTPLKPYFGRILPETPYDLGVTTANKKDYQGFPWIYSPLNIIKIMAIQPTPA